MTSDPAPASEVWHLVRDGKAMCGRPSVRFFMQFDARGARDTAILITSIGGTACPLCLMKAKRL